METEEPQEVPIVFDQAIINTDTNADTNTDTTLDTNTSSTITGVRTKKHQMIYKSSNSSKKILNQEKRRQQLLDRQKKAREENVNTHRNLTDFVMKSNPFYAIKPEFVKKYQYILMKSEWFHEIPSTLAEEWYCAMCPKGQRSLIVASKGITQSFNKNGFQTAIFNSALPGGSKATSNYSHLTLLDCIWDSTNQIIYVLDVLAWRNQTFLDCDTDFRFYWIRTQFDAMPELEKAEKNNDYAFKNVQRSLCDKNSLKKLFSENDCNLDGMLFYHRAAHYKAGRTPLVTWLLPWMAPEILELEAPKNSDPKPDKIKDQHAQEYITNLITMQRLRRKREKKTVLDIEMPMSTPEVNLADAISSIEMEIQNEILPTTTAEENITSDISSTEME